MPHADDELSSQDEQPTRTPKIENYELHRQAEQLVKQFGSDYAAALIIQARLLAFRQRANEVQSVHVERARDLIAARQGGAWVKELFLLLGGALLGACVQGFPAELEAGHKMLTATYAVFGLVGVALAFTGLLIGLRR